MGRVRPLTDHAPNNGPKITSIPNTTDIQCIFAECSKTLFRGPVNVSAGEERVDGLLPDADAALGVAPATSCLHSACCAIVNLHGWLLRQRNPQVQRCCTARKTTLLEMAARLDALVEGGAGS